MLYITNRCNGHSVKQTEAWRGHVRPLPEVRRRNTSREQQRDLISLMGRKKINTSHVTMRNPRIETENKTDQMKTKQEKEDIAYPCGPAWWPGGRPITKARLHSSPSCVFVSSPPSVVLTLQMFAMTWSTAKIAALYERKQTMRKHTDGGLQRSNQHMRPLHHNIERTKINKRKIYPQNLLAASRLCGCNGVSESNIPGGA